MTNKRHTVVMETDYERRCRVRYHEMMDTMPTMKGYSRDHVLSVMIVMNCDSTVAVGLLDQHGHDLDWSEATWTEIRDYFEGRVKHGRTSNH